MARRPSNTFLTSRDLVADCTQLLALAPSQTAALLNLKSCTTNTGCMNMKTEDQDLSVCPSDLTSHKANRRLQPVGLLLLASPTVLSIFMAGLSGHIWQHIAAALLQLPERPGQLQPVSAYTTCCWLVVPAEFLPRGRNNGAHRAQGVSPCETSPHRSHHTTRPIADPCEPHAPCSHGSARRPFLFKSHETTTDRGGSTLTPFEFLHITVS